MSELAQQAAKRLESALGPKATRTFEDGRGVVVRVEPEAVREALGVLKTDRECPFDMLSHIAGVDWQRWHEETGLEPPPARFGLVYTLYAVAQRTRIFVETFVADGQSVPSVTPLYASADWSEREVFDMFGVKFKGHPDLKRIYLTDDFEGHPLRKEFPRHGYDPQDHPQE